MSDKILAVCEQRDGKLRKVSFEVVTAARRLGDKVDAVVCDASQPESCAAAIAERAKTGGLVLENLDPQNTTTNPELWEKVVLKLRGGMMPPQGMPRPDATTIDANAMAPTTRCFLGRVRSRDLIPVPSP